MRKSLDRLQQMRLCRYDEKPHCYPCPIKQSPHKADFEYGENQCTFISEHIYLLHTRIFSMPSPSLQSSKLGEDDQIPKLARFDLMGKKETFFRDGFSRQDDLPGCMNELRNG